MLAVIQASERPSTLTTGLFDKLDAPALLEKYGASWPEGCITRALQTPFTDQWAQTESLQVGLLNKRSQHTHAGKTLLERILLKEKCLSCGVIAHSETILLGGVPIKSSHSSSSPQLPTEVDHLPTQGFSCRKCKVHLDSLT